MRSAWRAYNGWWFPAAAFGTGVIFGGVIARSGPVYRARRGRSAGANAHACWCFDRYRCCRAFDNTYQPIPARAGSASRPTAETSRGRRKGGLSPLNQIP